jgi:hypothetical protein
LRGLTTGLSLGNVMWSAIPAGRYEPCSGYRLFI